MKGFLASALALAERAGAVKLSAPLSLSISYDEEIGCVGIRQMMPELKDLIGKPRIVIVGEPSSMKVATGHKGKAAFIVTCHGQAGHSALAPQFVNAIHVAADFVCQTRRLQEKLTAGIQDDAYNRPYSTVHIGKIIGGRALNIVRDNAQLDMELRHLIDTSAGDIQHEIEGIAMQVSDAYPQASPITVELINAYPGLQNDPSDVTVLWATKLAEAIGSTKVPFGTEAGFFANLGLTTVVIGPGNMAIDGHQPDEGLSKIDLVTCDVMLNNILGELIA